MAFGDFPDTVGEVAARRLCERDEGMARRIDELLSSTPEELREQFDDALAIAEEHKSYGGPLATKTYARAVALGAVATVVDAPQELRQCVVEKIAEGEHTYDSSSYATSQYLQAAALALHASTMKDTELFRPPRQYHNGIKSSSWARISPGIL